MIKRLADDPYRWEVVEQALADVANVERKVPAEFITDDGFGITAACRRYLSPLIQGEAYPPYKDGLPDYVRLKNIAAAKKLTTTFTV
jgi:6-phosphofructokinase 1